MSLKSKLLRRVVAVMFLFVLVPLNAGGGCAGEAATDEFRNVASDGISSGLKTLLNAIIDGLFAVVEPNADTTN